MSHTKEYGLKATVSERWWCHYNGRLNRRYVCAHRGCSNKLRNGRCGLDMCRLEITEDRILTGNCLDFTQK